MSISNSIDRIKEKIREITERLESSDNGFVRLIPRATKVALAVLAIAALWYSYKKGSEYFGSNDEVFKATDSPTPAKVDYKIYQQLLNAQTNLSSVELEELVNKVNPSTARMFLNSKEMSDEGSSMLGSAGLVRPTWNSKRFKPFLSRLEDIAMQQESKDLLFLNKYINSLSVILELNEKNKDNDILDDLDSKDKELNRNIEQRAKYVSVELLNDKEFITFAKKNNMSDALKLVEEVNEKNKRNN